MVMWKCLQNAAIHVKRRQATLNLLFLPACNKTSSWLQHGLSTKSQETELVKQLKSKIKISGPITVAEYMQEVLSNPLLGYYMKKDVFGVDGDFVTSPEISQMFGEMIGIWFYDRWIHSGLPKNFQFVELGPGRGTLIADILRVFFKLGRISENLSLHLVEISPAMRLLQRTLLCGEERNFNEHQCNDMEMGEPFEGITPEGIKVTWYKSIFDIPKGPTFYLAHEFFDALPIHQFQKTKDGWREILVDTDEGNGPHHLKFCLAPSRTPATVLISDQKDVSQLEIRPQGHLIAEKMAQNIQDCGGCSLIVDYGDVKNDRHTLRAFRNHKLTSPLENPGYSDLTSNVDFSQIRRAFKNTGVQTFGPVTQRNFLISMGIDVRKQKLLEKASSAQARSIETAFRMLTDPSEMGNYFKFFSAVHRTNVPPGF